MVAKLQSLEYKWIVAIAFLLGIFMDLLDMTIVNVALPSIAKDFNVTEGGIEWLITGYTLSLAVWIPASGWLGDRFGTKRIFTIAIVAFTAGSLLCAMAWSLDSLIAFRVLQGIGGGMMTPVGTAMLMRAFPPAERARSSTILMIPIAVAPAVGPVLVQRLATSTGGLTDPGAIASGSVSAFHWAFGAAVVLSAIATIGGFMIKDEYAAATMHPKEKPKEAEIPPQKLLEEPVLAH